MRYDLCAVSLLRIKYKFTPHQKVEHHSSQRSQASIEVSPVQGHTIDLSEDNRLMRSIVKNGMAAPALAPS